MSHEKTAFMESQETALFNREWEKSSNNEIIKALKSGRHISEIFGPNSSFAKAFLRPGENLCCLKCSDGRVSDGGGVAGSETLKLAGEGLLLSPDQIDPFIAKEKNKIKLVTSHDECGAAALKFKQMRERGEALPEGVTNSDELGIYFAKQLARKLGAAYHHISKEKFVCPVHNERMLIIDGTARFNADKIPGFPPRFVSAALGSGIKASYVAEEASILSGIALGEHGLGRRFTSDNPFYVIIIARDQEQLQIAEDLLSDLENTGRISVQGLVAPEK